jgi:cellulose synthase/poly-beta-1,6-N-acetylglucosamine synthase-like glycosyltransferase
MSASEPIVSVIVPCFNSEQTIRRCLNALLEQNTSIPYDVTVVDSSLDETPRIVEKEFPSVRLIHLDTRTFAGAARNIGVRATRSPFCLMIDSDCIARNDLIERMIARHRGQEYAAVGGSLRNGTPTSLSGWTGYLLEFKEFIPTAKKRELDTVPTANVTYRRTALEGHGYFDDEMWLAEDILFNWKMRRAGERILFDPEIEVTHLNRTGWREVLSYQVSLGKCSAEARRRGSLPGNSLLRYPGLILLMPFVRLVKAAAWLARVDRQAFLMFLLISPMYFIGSCFWSVGFFKGARSSGILS